MRLQIDHPLSFGVLPWSHRPPQFGAVFIAKGTWTIAEDGTIAPAAEADYVTGDVHYGDDPTKSLAYSSDFAPFKPRTDVLVTGSAWAPGGTPVTSLPVAIRVGTVRKSLVVFGERRWRSSRIGPSGATDPKTFVTIPITYENAFGGPGYGDNPGGCGWNSDVAPLIEDPRRLSRGVGDDAPPAGFGPRPPSWPSRGRLSGTYDERWLRERWPWFPLDFDWGYFNAAPVDQQVPGYLRGDEELTFQNLHRSVPLLQSRLPGVRVRCVLTERWRETMQHREVPLTLDTVAIDLEHQRIVIVWRGAAEVRTFKFKEIEEVRLLAEALTSAPRAIEDCVKPAVVAPPPPSLEPAESRAMELAAAELDREMAALSDQIQQMDQEFADADLRLEAALAEINALRIAEQKPPLSLPALPDSDDDLVSWDTIDRTTLMLRDQLRERAPQAAAQFEAFEDPELGSTVQELEAIRAELDVELPPLADGTWTRERVVGALEADTPLVDIDLSSLDLVGLDLSGVNLSGSKLSKARLTDAVLAGANLRAADLSDADLSGVDLTGAILAQADLTGAVLTGVTFTSVDLEGATLQGVDLSNADLSGIRGAEADFTGVKAPHCRFAGAVLTATNFTSSDVSSADFEGARLGRARFFGATARGAHFAGADLTGLQASEGADFSAADLRMARMDGAVFEESVLNGADFSRSTGERAQFTDASLRQARFDRARLSGASFDDADLQGAVLTHADLRHASFDRCNLENADLRWANAFEAGFWLARTGGASAVGANLKGTLLRR
jgi:uncharacterized protein YjbI with pentapeptide repeats